MLVPISGFFVGGENGLGVGIKRLHELRPQFTTNKSLSGSNPPKEGIYTLCLSRNVSQKILVGTAMIEILEVTRSGKVRLGITAPENIEVWRTELLGPDGRPATPRKAKEPTMALKGGLE